MLNIGALITVARVGSFSAAAREIETAPSVVAKRISQLEHHLGTRLINRSTRGLALTAAGERYLPRFVRLLAEHDDIFRIADTGGRQVEGLLRVQSPPSVMTLFLGSVLIDFQLQHPRADLAVIVTERSVNPMEENFDIALGAWPVSYPNVVDVPLCRYDLVMVCSPDYLSGRDRPQHPAELVDHNCLTTALLRTSWSFTHVGGSMNIEVHSHMHSSDSCVVRDAARRGLGVAVLPPYLVREDLKAGKLVPLLEDFPITTHWMNAQVPRMRLSRPAVRVLVDFLKKSMQPVPPWEK
jgi:DNA-binding transcriptional LysR family regulator